MGTTETIVLFFLAFIVVMTALLWLIPDNKIKAITGFFKEVLPRIPFVGMVKAYSCEKFGREKS